MAAGAYYSVIFRTGAKVTFGDVDYKYNDRLLDESNQLLKYEWFGQKQGKFDHHIRVGAFVMHRDKKDEEPTMLGVVAGMERVRDNMDGEPAKYHVWVQRLDIDTVELTNDVFAMLMGNDYKNKALCKYFGLTKRYSPYSGLMKVYEKDVPLDRRQYLDVQAGEFANHLVKLL